MPSLEDVLDKVLELGFEDYLVEDLDLLNEVNWDRIYVLRAMNYPIDTKEDLLSILHSSSFFVSDDKLDSYIPNIVPYYDHTIYGEYSLEALEEYRQGSRLYNVSGVLLSKRRILRHLSVSNDLFQSAIQGSVLSHDEVSTIEKEFRGKVYTK